MQHNTWWTYSKSLRRQWTAWPRLLVGNFFVCYKRRTIAGLCYFHLVLQGWDRIVCLNLSKEGKQYDINNVLLPQVKEYIETWYFDFENEHEYKLSKEKFYLWLASLEQGGLTKETHMHVR